MYIFDEHTGLVVGASYEHDSNAVAFRCEAGEAWLRFGVGQIASGVFFSDLHVHEHMRGNGYGRTLFDAAVRYAVDEQIDFFMTDATNERTVKMFDRFGADHTLIYAYYIGSDDPILTDWGIAEAISHTARQRVREGFPPDSNEELSRPAVHLAARLWPSS